MQYIFASKQKSSNTMGDNSYDTNVINDQIFLFYKVGEKKMEIRLIRSEMFTHKRCTFKFTITCVDYFHPLVTLFTLCVLFTIGNSY